MNDVFQRDSYDPRGIEARNLAMVVIILVVSSAAWHGIRGLVLYRVACSSIGCVARRELIAAALRPAHPNVPDHPQFWEFNVARPTWIAWSSARDNTHSGDDSELQRRQVTVADRQLKVRGMIGADRLSSPPDDPDGDGRCEVVLRFDLRGDNGQLIIRRWAVVRLGKEINEIIWVGLADANAWGVRRAAVRPIWRDEDGDGIREFVFTTLEIFRRPQAEWGFKPPNTVAVFAWDAPGGMLHPRSMPDDGSILSWTPPEKGPVKVEQDADLDPLLRKLLPVPAGFGQ